MTQTELEFEKCFRWIVECSGNVT